MTVTRWITRGVRVAAGRVRLRADRVGSRWLIPVDAIEEFFSATTAGNLADGAAGPRGPAARASAAGRAIDALRQMGVE